MADKKTITYSGRLGSFEYDPTVFDICVIQKECHNSKGHMGLFNTEVLVYMGTESNDDIDLPDGVDKFYTEVLTMPELEEYVKQLDNQGLCNFIDKNPQKRELVDRLTEFDYDTYVSEHKVVKPEKSTKRDRIIALFEGQNLSADRSIADD